MTRKTGFPKSVIELVTVRSGGHCEILSTGCQLAADQFHHRRPRGMGGTLRDSTAANCLHVCRACHGKAESMRSWARDNGYLVGQADDPAGVPCWWRCNRGRGGRKVLRLLDDGGNMSETGTKTDAGE